MRAHTSNTSTNGFETLFDLIGELARRRYQAAERHFSTLGFNHTEARLLTLLSKHKGEALQDTISSQLSIDRSNAGRALQNLHKSGYILRRKHDTDKRANLLELTPKGRKAAAEIAKLRTVIAQNVFGGLKETEAAEIAQRLGKATIDD